jgi:hypothetical protein
MPDPTPYIPISDGQQGKVEQEEEVPVEGKEEDVL